MFRTMLIALNLFVALATASAVPKNECTTAACRASAKMILSRMDNKTDPCTDLYQFSCGKWIKETVIPPGKDVVWADEAEPDLETPRNMFTSGFTDSQNPLWPQMKSFYDSCAAFSKSSAPVAALKPHLEQLQKLIPQTGLVDNVLTDSLIFSNLWWVNNIYFARVNGEGIKFSKTYSSLAYYPGSTAKQIAKVKENIVAKLEATLGDSAMKWEKVDFDAVASQIIDVDRSLYTVKSGKKGGIFKTSSFGKLGGGLFDMAKVVQAMGIKNIGEVEVTVPYETYFADMWEAMKKNSPSAIKYYLIYNLIDGTIWALGDKLSNLVSGTMLEYTYMTPRTEIQYCLLSTMTVYATAFRRSFNLYKNITPNDIARTQKIFSNLKKQLSQRLPTVGWQDKDQKQAAFEILDKLSMFMAIPPIAMNNTFLTSYYSSLRLGSGNYFDKVIVAGRFLQTINTDGKYTAAEMMALPSMDMIITIHRRMYFTAANFYLQHFSSDDLPALQYSSVGADITDTMVGTVFESLLYAGDVPELEVYNNILNCNANQISKFQLPLTNMHPDADYGKYFYLQVQAAVKLTYDAWKSETADDVPMTLPGLAAYTEEQLFFIRNSQGACLKGTKSYYENDSFPPIVIVNNGAMNSDEFARAFKCKLNAPLNPTKKCQFF